MARWFPRDLAVSVIVDNDSRPQCPAKGFVLLLLRFSGALKPHQSLRSLRTLCDSAVRIDTITPAVAFGDEFTLGFPRSKLASSLTPVLRDSGDLIEWFLRTDFSLESFPLDDTHDWIELYVPREVGELKRFYQIAIPR